MWLAATGAFFRALLPMPEYMLQALTSVVSFAVIAALFALIYKFMPEVDLMWRDVAAGAALTSLLFSLGKLLIGLYLGKTSLGSTYGAAGSLVVLLVWVYYSAQVFLLGAEFTQVFAHRHGRGARTTLRMMRRSTNE
jgi:membrane protein